MSHPYSEDDRSDVPTKAWGDGGSDETQVVGPDPGSYDPSPSSAGIPLDREGPGPAPGGSAVVGPLQPGWSPSYSDQSAYPAPPATTSVYPLSTPGYAPAGYPAAYAPAEVVPPPASAQLPTKPSSRVGPGFLGFLIGLILTAGGIWLGAKYGIAAATAIQGRSIVVKDSVLATLGGILLLAAVVLNGWSPWATVIPGIALTGIGGWALFDTSAATRVSAWTKSLISENVSSAWHISGFTLILGLVLVAASVAATIARASGKRDGQILGRRTG